MFRTVAELKSVILSEVDWQKDRGCHTTETVLAVAREMMTLYGLPVSICETVIRVSIAELLHEGRLDMTPSGILALPAESPEPKVIKFERDWFVLEGETIIGPLNKGEITKYVSVGTHI